MSEGERISFQQLIKQYLLRMWRERRTCEKGDINLQQQFKLLMAKSHELLSEEPWVSVLQVKLLLSEISHL